MRRIALTLELVTPAFLGGVKQDAEWRGPSIRGQLRFWFRVLAGAELGGDLGQIRAAERRVFGTTDQASPLAVRCGPAPEASTDGSFFGRRWSAEDLAAAWGDPSPSTVRRLRIERNGREILSNPAHYLGYGPFDATELKRSFLSPEVPLSLTLTVRREIAEADFDLFTRALGAWLQLGGIGCRSRRGFGSLVCVECSDEKIRKKIQVGEEGGFGARLADLLGARPAGAAEPDFTHLGPKSRVLVSETFASASHALAHAGAWLVAFRRRYGMPADPRLPGIGEDYSWAAAPGAAGAKLPDRAGFGLPLAFRQGGGSHVVKTGGEDPRRASPLFLHIARLGPEDHRAVFTHLPSSFYPAPALPLLRLQGQGSTAATAPTAGMLSVVDRFLDDLARKSLLREVWL